MAQDETPPTDLIQVNETVRREMQADHADLIVTVRGSSFVAGTAALSKAREVSQLVADLRQAGIADADIHLQNVEAEVGTGMLGRNSTAVYQLRIECRDLECLPDALGAITAQKNSKLDQLRWLYPNDETARNALLQQCVRQAQEKAHLIAGELGVRLIGVRSLTYQFFDPESPAIPAGLPMQSVARARSTISQESLDMQVSHTKELAVHISASYRISEITATG